MADRLVIFTRYPEPGKTKTRLIPYLGADGAAELQREMGIHVLSAARAFTKENPADIEVRFDGGNPLFMRHWLGFDLIYQGRGDLGARMSRAFPKAFAAAERVVIIGADCPSITPEDIADAFNTLHKSDIVVGPTEDGGYYLIGLRKEALKADFTALFRDMHWGTDRVFDETVSRARKLGWVLTLLEKRRDVDRREDIEWWQYLKKQAPANPKPLLSVIIPTLSDGENIAATLENLNGLPNIEVIICDGGWSNWQPDVTHARNVRIIKSEQCRARQMNEGAAQARGELILFLHGDTRLPKGFEGYVRYVLDLPGVIAGAFELAIDDARSGLRIIERLVNWRSRRLQRPYGDQGIFLKASVFQSQGRFPDFPIMEDF